MPHDKDYKNFSDFLDSQTNIDVLDSDINNILRSQKMDILDLKKDCEVNTANKKIDTRQTDNFAKNNINLCNNDDVLLLTDIENHTENNSEVINNIVKQVIEEKLDSWLNNNLHSMVELTVQKLVKEKLLSKGK